MATDNELRSWTTPGAQDAAKATYDSVKAALSQSTDVQAYNVDVFLQGSYANHTNTRGDSDVDIVVMMRSAYQPDLSRLTVLERLLYQNSRIPATTTLGGLREAVSRALTAYYGGSRVHIKNKCIRVDKRGGYVDADVVPAQQYRLYTSFPSVAGAKWIEGMTISPLHGPRIVNYPKGHIRNGEAKNQRCLDRYKPTVRQIKRLRRRAVDWGLVGPGEAPGYLLECLTYNVPADRFVANDADRVRRALDWLASHTASQLKASTASCDGVHRLFADDPGDHDEHTARRVLQALRGLA